MLGMPGTTGQSKDVLQGFSFIVSFIWHDRLLSTRSEEREVLGVGSIPVAILPPCQDMKSVEL